MPMLTVSRHASHYHVCTLCARQHVCSPSFSKFFRMNPSVAPASLECSNDVSCSPRATSKAEAGAAGNVPVALEALGGGDKGGGGQG